MILAFGLRPEGAGLIFEGTDLISADTGWIFAVFGWSGNDRNRRDGFGGNRRRSCCHRHSGYRPRNGYRLRNGYRPHSGYHRNCHCLHMVFLHMVSPHMDFLHHIEAFRKGLMVVNTKYRFSKNY